MPELPEVESIAVALRAALAGRRLTGLRVEFAGIFEPSARAFRRAVLGRRLDSVHRHGKYLILTFDADGPSPAHAMLHLRMTGQVFVDPRYIPDEHVHAVFDFDGRPVFYRDVRKFGRWTLVDDGERPSAIAHVGPDMLKVRFAEWSAKVCGRKAPWKAVLLDQTVAAGLGNIYVDEALFRAGVHPLAVPADTGDETPRRIFDAAKGVLRLSIKHGGTTFLDFRDFHGKPGNFRRKLRVFGRRGEACRRCGGIIEKIVVAGRGTHFCPGCQAR
ncbi:bifunctional DNA-formamidopyrimidine glycosylase/DNA-(apurinic or apyrimidinic site) lyase [bacterium]|nr:bifunctional DNA-formamidopyrimidine glycosylase/DNA-(apurinic or apyrimidinic site) lyase [bacterium]MBU1676679.1 bifunctional DNA-formamidopyrimidine glycosylase/DNA-(apurinic or apyrimidinic site) lyase [bacterium]